jgi:hypothetical protein
LVFAASLSAFDLVHAATVDVSQITASLQPHTRVVHTDAWHPRPDLPEADTLEFAETAKLVLSVSSLIPLDQTPPMLADPQPIWRP